MSLIDDQDGSAGLESADEEDEEDAYYALSASDELPSKDVKTDAYQEVSVTRVDWNTWLYRRNSLDYSFTFQSEVRGKYLSYYDRSHG